MYKEPETIEVNQIADVICREFKNKESITCYLSSNAATPTASIEALTQSIRSRTPALPFIKMVHLLLQGPVPYLDHFPMTGHILSQILLHHESAALVYHQAYETRFVNSHGGGSIF